MVELAVLYRLACASLWLLFLPCDAVDIYAMLNTLCGQLLAT